MKQAVDDVQRLNEEYKCAAEAINRVAVHFGEDVQKFKVEECFALLGNFFERIDVVAKVSQRFSFNCYRFVSEFCFVLFVSQPFERSCFSFAVSA